MPRGTLYLRIKIRRIRMLSRVNDESKDGRQKYPEFNKPDMDFNRNLNGAKGFPKGGATPKTSDYTKNNPGNGQV
jgi:hypothetical protein